MKEAEMPRLLVTGAGGFIGSGVAQSFLQSGWAVTGLTRRQCPSLPFPTITTDPLDHGALAVVIETFRPHVILHGAGSAAVGRSFQDPAADFDQSVGLFRTLLEAVRRSHQTPKILLPSSAAVYGEPEYIPISESSSCNPISPYGYHKLICENLAKEYAYCFNIPVVVSRLFSVFGEDQRRLLIWDLFIKLRENGQITIDGTGEETRDYLPIEVVGEIFVRLALADLPLYTAVNVASGTARRVRDVADLMARHFNCDKPVSVRGHDRPGNPDHWQADVTLLGTFLGGLPQVDFDGVLKKVLDKWSQ